MSAHDRSNGQNLMSTSSYSRRTYQIVADMRERHQTAYNSEKEKKEKGEKTKYSLSSANL
jgi:hypothetical protein